MRAGFTFLFLVLTLVAHTQTFEECVQSGHNKIQNKDFNGAIKDFSKAIEQKKSAPSLYKLATVYVNRGILRQALGNNEQALKDYKAAQEIVPEFTKAYYVEAQLQLALKQYTKAMAAVDKCISLTPSNIDYTVLKCIVYESENKFENALSCIDSFISKNGRSVAALNIRAHNQSFLKRYEDSKNTYTEVLELEPKNTEAMFNRALAKGELKDYAGAEADNLYAASVDTAMACVAYNNIGFFIKAGQNDWQGAIEWYDKAIKAKPALSYYAYSNRGFAKFKLNDIKGAKSDLKKSLEMNPENSYAYKYLAVISIAEGKIKEACGYLEKAEKLNYTVLYDNEVKDLMEQHCR